MLFKFILKIYFYYKMPFNFLKSFKDCMIKYWCNFLLMFSFASVVGEFSVRIFTNERTLLKNVLFISIQKYSLESIFKIIMHTYVNLQKQNYKICQNFENDKILLINNLMVQLSAILFWQHNSHLLPNFVKSWTKLESFSASLSLLWKDANSQNGNVLY